VQQVATNAAAATHAPEGPEAVRQQSEANLQEEPEAEPQERQLTALQEAAAYRDWEVLRHALQDTDPALQSAAFAALAAQYKAGAVEELWANVQDTSQPTRLQALALLVQNAEADERTVIEALREALQDPDPAFNAYAVQILAGRDDADAVVALREALHSPDPSIRLMILESVVHTEAGLLLLREALADSDETVKDVAAMLLKQAEAVAGIPGKP
jgi:HEAT repeat protein